MIKFENVTKRFGDAIAVEDMSIDFEKGTMSVIIGPSGCGKTTSMKLINRLVEPDEGNITIDGKSIFNYDPVLLRRNIGYVIQGTGLLPHYSVFDNIAIVPKLLKWNKKKIEQRVLELLDLVTLDESFADAYPSQLSGGEQQRVGIARALAADPEILLMDEPFGAIDSINRRVLQDTLLEIQEIIKKTIIFVTHDINEAIKMGDKIAIMNEGTLVQFDAPQEILVNPENEFVENLLGHDRNIKALTLKKAKEYILETGFFTTSDMDESESLNNFFKDNPKELAFILSHDRILQGRFKRINKKDGSFSILKEAKFEYIDRNMSITETLSKMLESGERQLPVLNGKKQFLGIVSLEKLFKELSQDQ